MPGEQGPRHDREKRETDGSLSIESLIEQGEPSTSDWSFVRDLASVTPDWDIKNDETLRLLYRRLAIRPRNAGVGYASASVENDRAKELRAAAFVRWSLAQRARAIESVVLPVDQLYRFDLDQDGLVGKLFSFNDQLKEHALDPKYAFVVTDFADSIVFDDQTLANIPHQEAAGLKHGAFTKLGDVLYNFGRRGVSELLKESKGDLRTTLDTMMDRSRASEADAKLLLATSLLLQDEQRWQDPWYEHAPGDQTSLFVVGPKSFHDAMNRLNDYWGHGTHDYAYRSANSLGNFDAPLFDEEPPVVIYKDQGPDSETFSARIEPVLRTLYPDPNVLKRT